MAVLARFLIVCWAVSCCCVIISVLNGIGIREFWQKLETGVSRGCLCFRVASLAHSVTPFGK